MAGLYKVLRTLSNGNIESQVSSRRFFMYCPCLYGLTASPGTFEK